MDTSKAREGIPELHKLWYVDRQGSWITYPPGPEGVDWDDATSVRALNMWRFQQQQLTMTHQLVYTPPGGLTGRYGPVLKSGTMTLSTRLRIYDQDPAKFVWTTTMADIVAKKIDFNAEDELEKLKRDGNVQKPFKKRRGRAPQREGGEYGWDAGNPGNAGNACCA